MNKILSKAMALTLAAGIACSPVAAFAADNQNAKFTKTYTATNDGTTSPEETFTFTFTPESITDSNANLKVSDMPAIPNTTVKADAGTATTAGATLDVDVALKDIEWPGVGVYIYNVAEIEGTTAGVTYSDKTAKLKVTVAYDEGTDTYYTAFVTMALEDSDNNGIDDAKDDGNFTNTYSAGNLQISKTVTGNMGSQEQYFAVNVKLTGVDGKTYGDSYAVTGGSKIEDGTATCTTSAIKIGEEKTFYLKHNETITIANLPYDVTYTVEEQDYTDNEKGGYDEAAYTFSDESKKIDSATDTVGITNNKGITVDTGIYTEKLPYILLGVIAAAGIVVMFAKRRPSKED